VSLILALALIFQNPQAVMDGALVNFAVGRFEAAAAGFDEVVRLVPDAEAGLWQRGIALYYAGRYQDCREQFELHRTVNPNDVENAVWHFMCVILDQVPGYAHQVLAPDAPCSMTASCVSG
jgi:lipoprotein NlpI